jgi:hypothetical protein
LDEAPGQHDLACPEKSASPSKVAGEPRERRVRVPHYVGAGSASDLDAMDERLTDHLGQLGRCVPGNRPAQDASGGKEVVRNQRWRVGSLTKESN